MIYNNICDTCKHQYVCTYLEHKLYPFDENNKKCIPVDIEIKKCELYDEVE